MATSYVNGVVFTPAANGTVDFVVSAAVTGWQTPASAVALNGATYRYRAASVDGSQWEDGTGVYTVSTTTLTRASVKQNSLGTTAKIAFTLPPQVTLTIFDDDISAFVSNTDSRVLSGNLNFTATNSYFTTGWFVGVNVLANTTALVVGTSVVNSTALSLGGSPVANSTGANNAFNLGGSSAASYLLISGVAANVAAYLPTYAGIVNAASYNTGATGTGTGGLIANVTTLFIGNNTVNVVMNTSSLSISGTQIANSTGSNNAFKLGGVAAASYITITGNYTITGLYTINANLSVNGAIFLGASNGTPGQVLTSNGTSNAYWSTVSGGSSTFTANVGDASTLVYTLTHNLNKTNAIVVIREISSGFYVYPDITYLTTNSLSLGFVLAPTANQYFATVVGV